MAWLQENSGQKNSNAADFVSKCKFAARCSRVGTAMQHLFNTPDHAQTGKPALREFRLAKTVVCFSAVLCACTATATSRILLNTNAAAAPEAADPPRTLYRAPSRENLSGGGSGSGLPRVPSGSNLEVMDIRGVAAHPWCEQCCIVCIAVAVVAAPSSFLEERSVLAQHGLADLRLWLQSNYGGRPWQAGNALAILWKLLQALMSLHSG